MPINFVKNLKHTNHLRWFIRISLTPSSGKLFGMLGCLELFISTVWLAVQGGQKPIIAEETPSKL